MSVSPAFPEHQPYLTQPLTTPAPQPVESLGSAGGAFPRDTMTTPFAVVALPSLYATIGTPIGTVTLATVTCPDGAATIQASGSIPGLTLAYAGNVLTISGTPTGSSGFYRLVVTFITSDGTLRSLGSVEVEVTIVKGTEVLTIGSMAGITGRVGVPLTATLASPSTNYSCPMVALATTQVPGLDVALAWTVGASSASGTLSVSGTPTVAGTYSLVVGYWSNGVQLGSSTHAAVISEAYEGASPAPAPAAGPPGVVPPAPAPAAPAPAPGVSADPYLLSTPILMRFNTSRGIAYNERDGLTKTNSGGYQGVGAVDEAACFFSGGYIDIPVNESSGDWTGDLTVEVMVDLSLEAFNSLIDVALGREISSTAYMPVVSFIGDDGHMIWTVGFSALDRSIVDYPPMIVVSFIIGCENTAGGYPFNNGVCYASLPANPGRYVNLVATISGVGCGIWWDGKNSGSNNTLGSPARRVARSGIIRIAGEIPKEVLGYKEDRNTAPYDPLLPYFPYLSPTLVQAPLLPFIGCVDELRIACVSRFGLPVYGTDLQAYQSVIPRPNF